MVKLPDYPVNPLYPLSYNDTQEPAPPPRLLLVFVDGLGLGPAGDHNPLSYERLPRLRRLLGGRRLTADAFPGRKGTVHQGEVTPAEAGHPGLQTRLFVTDAGLGVAGLPQSATGQTSLLTGRNAPAAIGRHLHAYPSPDLRQLLRRHSLFRQVTSAGLRATFLNAFREPDYERLRQERFLSASTLSVMAAGLPYRHRDHLRRRQAVFHDLTGDGLRRRGWQGIPEIDPVEAGEIAAQVSRGFHFTLLEYFLTDLAGHRQDADAAGRRLRHIDGLIAGLLQRLDWRSTLLMIVSDHGNVENLGTGSHTDNPVATVLVGSVALLRAASGDHGPAVADLTDVASTVMAVLTRDHPPPE